MGLPWIKVYGDIRGHQKTIKLELLLGVEDGGHHFAIDLWLWAARHAPDGLIAGTGGELARIVAKACGWSSTRGGLSNEQFLSAMVKTGFVDLTDTGAIIHDWQDYQASHLRKLEYDKARLRAARKASIDNADAHVVTTSKRHRTTSFSSSTSTSLRGETGAPAADAGRASTPFDEACDDAEEGCPPAFEGHGEFEEPLSPAIPLSKIRGEQPLRRRRGRE